MNILKYKLLGENRYFLNSIDTILKNRGIENIQSFLNVSNKNVIHWSKLKNMDLAVNCLLKHVKGGGKVFVQTDADP